MALLITLKSVTFFFIKEGKLLFFVVVFKGGEGGYAMW